MLLYGCSSKVWSNTDGLLISISPGGAVPSKMPTRHVSHNLHLFLCFLFSFFYFFGSFFNSEKSIILERKLHEAEALRAAPPSGGFLEK